MRRILLNKKNIKVIDMVTCTKLGYQEVADQTMACGLQLVYDWFWWPIDLLKLPVLAHIETSLDT